MEEEVAKGGAAEEEAAEEVVEEEVVEEVVAEEQAVFDGEESDAGSVEYIRSRAPEEEQRVAAEEEQRVVAEEEQRAVAEEEQRAAAEEEQRAAAQRAAEDADTEEEEELSAAAATNGSEANAYHPVTDFPLGNERTALAGLHTSLAIRGVMTEFDTPSPRGPRRRGSRTAISSRVLVATRRGWRRRRRWRTSSQSVRSRGTCSGGRRAA